MPGLGSALAPSAFSLAKSVKSSGQTAVGGNASPPNGNVRPGQQNSGQADAAQAEADPSPPFADPTPVEESLEAELVAPSLDPSLDRDVGTDAGLRPGEAAALAAARLPAAGIALETLSEEDALVELAHLRLERACRDVIDDARTEALMSRIVRNRDEVFADPFPSGRNSSGDEPPGAPPASAFSRRVSARRLAYAACAIALLAAAPLTLGGDPTQWPARVAALFADDTGAVEAVEWRRRPLPESEQSGVMATFAAGGDAWRLSLAERLANQATPLPEGGTEERLQQWQEKLAPKVQLVEEAPPVGESAGNEDGVTLAVADALEEDPKAQTQAIRSAALADSIVRVGPAPRKDEAAAAAEAKTEAKVETAALASPRPEDVLAAAAAREEERKAEQASAPKPVPRDAKTVELALVDAPGLDVLRTSQRRELTARLVAGECLATALGDYFSPVPVLLMRDLVRDLDSEC